MSWCVAPFFVRRPLNAGAVALVYAVATGIAMAVVFADRLPHCYIEGVGLTPFKIWSEYAFVGLFALALVLLARESHAFDRAVHRTLMLSLPLSVTAEIAFTRYAGVFDAANEAGHLLMLAAILLVYRAILVTGIVNPFDLLFREARLREEELELRVRTRTAQLAESEARFQQLFDCSADGILLVDDSNRIIEANQTACTRLGYMKAELTGLPVDRIRADGHAKEDYDNVRRAGEAVFEAVQKTSDGRLIPVEVNARVVDHAGEHAVLSVARDITERVRALAKIRESGELLERMFSAVHVLIAYLDRDLNFVRVNDAYAAADGRTPDYFVGKNHFALYPNPDLEAAFRRVIESGNPDSRLEHPFTYPEHPEFGVTYWDWRLDPVRGASGDVQGAILSLLDVTERREAQEALRALNRSLRMLSQCNATLVHAADEHTLVKEMCRIIAEVGLYDSVWIGLVQGRGDLSVRPVACSQCAANAMDACVHAQQDRQLVREVLRSGEQRA
ncbi:MAG TPA: MASE3 domain-containing protein, partial [Burkholderiales bacterium]|nr:MASE3 domain-containing protein [Burkholderiales bacterium]